MCLDLVVFFISVIILIISAIIYTKAKKGSVQGYTKGSSPFAYLDAYNRTYSPPRPQFYQDCVSYNQWVRDANYVGRKIASECNKKFPGDVRCPMDNPWVETPCGL